MRIRTSIHAKHTYIGRTHIAHPGLTAQRRMLALRTRIPDAPQPSQPAARRKNAATIPSYSPPTPPVLERTPTQAATPPLPMPSPPTAGTLSSPMPPNTTRSSPHGPPPPHPRPPVDTGISTEHIEVRKLWSAQASSNQHGPVSHLDTPEPALR